MNAQSAEAEAGRKVSGDYDVLLISADFFGYAGEIRKELEARGHRVLYFDDRPATTTLMKALLRIAPILTADIVRRYMDEVVRQATRHAGAIREVLVIKGESVSARAIGRLRAALPQARFTLYLWDSYRNMPEDTAKKVSLFDQAFSFDPADCRRDPRLTYRPLFYANSYDEKSEEVQRDIDISFIGTIHTDRYRVITRLISRLPADTKIKTYMYYPSRRLLMVRRLLDPAMWGARLSEFAFSPMPHAEAADLVRRSRIALDIERKVQSGLTMRTIEMLGACRKLITTNAEIRYADFYDERNICIIDRRNPVVPEDFIHVDYVRVSDAVRSRYSLAGWVDEIFAWPRRGEDAFVSDKVSAAEVVAG